MELGKAGHDPEKDMLQGALFSVDHIPLEVGVEVAVVTEHLKEATDTLLSLVLSLFLYINSLVYIIKVGKEFV